MTHFEEFILTDFIPKNSIMNTEGKYIVDSENIEKLRLNPTQKKLLLRTLKKYQIEVKESETPIQETRSPLAKDFDYGEISSINDSKNDIPVYSQIQYDANDTPIFENYDKLEEFLDKKFIPSVIQTKKVEDPMTGEFEFYSFIPINKIINLKLSELEVKHTIEFLDSKDIMVTGKNSTLDSEFNNYHYISTYKTQHLPELKSWEEQQKWFKEYRKTKDAKIRQAIIEANLRLVPFITSKLAYTYHIDINELNSYGYEKLIETVDSFDVTKGNKFSTFAYICIRNHIHRILPSLLGFKNLDIYNNFITATQALTDLYEQNGIDRETTLEEITTWIQNMNNYGDIKTRNIGHEIMMGNIGNIEDIAEDNRYAEDYSLARSILNSYSHNELMKAIDTLTDREKFVLIQRYGLEDGEFKSQEKVGRMVGVGRVRIGQIEHQALRKLRHPNRKKALLGLLEDYDELTYDETAHFKKI